MDTLTSWLVALMVTAAPPERLVQLEPDPGETALQRTDRYVKIASAARAVAFDPAEAPLFGGRHPREMTAVLLLSIAFHESGFAHDVDVGPCDRRRFRGRCDSGAAACVMQLEVGGGVTAEGWTREELFADREKCFRSALHKLRGSAGLCRALPRSEHWTAYAAGDCRINAGRVHSRAFDAIARRWVARAPFPE